MKRNVTQHTKFLRLKATLGLRTFEAVGVLEALWHLTARQTPRGDIGRLTDDDIALALDWPLDSVDSLMTGLVSTGWLDRHPTYRLVVHDWHDHADDTTKKLILRKKWTFASGGHGAPNPDDGGGCRDTSGNVATSTEINRLPIAIASSQSQKKEEISSANADSSDSATAEPNPPVDSASLTPDPDPNRCTVDDLVEGWNELSDYTHNQLPRVRIPISAERRRKAAARVRDHPDRAYWTQVLHDIADSPFLCGEGGTGWSATFDWLLRPDSSAKVLEGNYRRLRAVTGGRR